VPTTENNILDVVMTDEPLIVSNIEVCAPFSTSNHSHINFHIFIESSGNKTGNGNYNGTHETYNCWKLADYVTMASYLHEIDRLALGHYLLT